MTRPDLRLYLIVDPEQCGGRADLADIAAAAVRGGATLVQYRDKHAETGAFIETARAIGTALRTTGVPLLINDRVDVALAAGADGIHIGQSDIVPRDARRLLGPRGLIGLTIKTERDAQACPEGVVDYACIGGVFVTASKDNADAPIGLLGLAARVRVFKTLGSALPLGAIAGINERNVGPVMSTGVDGVAVITAITKAADPEEASRALRRAVDASLESRAADTLPLAVAS